MANSSDGISSPPEPPSRSRGIRAFFRKLRAGRAEAPPPGPTSGPNGLVEQAAAFQTLRVSDVMTPRVDIVAVELSTSFSEVVDLFAESEHSRMPIYRETLDDPVGVIHVKDIFKLLAGRGRRPGPSDLVLQKLRRDALYVPGSMRAADLLLTFGATRMVEGWGDDVPEGTRTDMAISVAGVRTTGIPVCKKND